MDILFSIIVAGFAVGYFLEFLSSLLSRWVTARLLKLSLTLPLSLVALLLLGVPLSPSCIVYTPAAGFVSLVIMALVLKPTEVTQVVNRR